MFDDGEPISAGRRDRRAAEAKAVRTVLLIAGLFTLVFVVNAIVAILLLGLLGVGWL